MNHTKLATSFHHGLALEDKYMEGFSTNQGGCTESTIFQQSEGV